MNWDKVRHEKQLKQPLVEELAALLNQASRDDSTKAQIRNRENLSLNSRRTSSGNNFRKPEIEVTQEYVEPVPGYEGAAPEIILWARAFVKANSYGAMGKFNLTEGFLEVATGYWEGLTMDHKSEILASYN